MDYLLKTEPSTYSFADLQREKNTIWDGVSNPVALKNMRNMKPGDGLIIYETGDMKSAVGSANRPIDSRRASRSRSVMPRKTAVMIGAWPTTMA